ncbi:signal peptidase II [Mycobacterium sp. B14F4]|uniref:signal peptidase II n=1 Tax=Mycobacterium sp. B14F4 TaxID=3153565 RepID=UPI00325F912A
MSLVQFTAAAVMTLALILDQVSKVAAQALLPEAAPRPANGPLRLEVVRNHRVGLGRITVRRHLRVALGVLAAAAGLLLVVLAPLSSVSALGLGLAIGGAAGNLTDLLTRGHVVDFISIGRWPTFNLADFALCCGVALALIGLT